MPRAWRPIVAGAVVAAAVFLLAQWPIFEPSASSTPGGELLTGADRGAVLFVEECAGCHGRSGTGGTGPPLAESGLDADEIAAAIEQGPGTMPPGIVTGQNQEDVVAYVESIAG
jgi:mono/diheme cytochrome c family protein